MYVHTHIMNGMYLKIRHAAVYENAKHDARFFILPLLHHFKIIIWCNRAARMIVI